jgi:hypothetical protein
MGWQAKSLAVAKESGAEPIKGFANGGPWIGLLGTSGLAVGPVPLAPSSPRQRVVMFWMRCAAAEPAPALMLAPRVKVVLASAPRCPVTLIA